MNILVATGNAGKLRELRQLLEPQGHQILGLGDLAITEEPLEDGATFRENALKKADFFAERSGIVTIADDSGLCVDALDGAPGVFSARYAGPDADDAANNEKLLRELADESHRAAHFVCVAVCAKPGGDTVDSRGECSGEIVAAPQGDGGFGYDPLFYVAEYDATFAQLPPDVKNRISHRGKAIRGLVHQLADFLVP
ncbi:MAG: XTP/dITP diphosphatase [Candidatus Lernaella stagnicola]|nr:XTP/dITP diphosphatase [Candidatus Lernaella stagnicola]